MKELILENEILNVFFLIKQLRKNLTQKEFLAKVLQAQKEAKYKLFAFEYEGRVVSLCGVMPFFVLYHSDCLYICDFVVDAAFRGRGFGEKFLKEVESWAKSNGYREIELSSSFFREQAHRFYIDKMCFDKSGFVFKKVLH